MKLGEKDSRTKKYMSNPIHFADFFNGILYEGQQIIKPEMLMEKDTTEIALPFARGKKGIAVQKYRDLLKQCIIMESEDSYYVLLGLENQSDIHYAMPVRNMLYNAITYSNQVDTIVKKNRENKEEDDFLSGFQKNDKVMPVITLTLYWGDEPWDGPRTLKQMMGDYDSSLDKFIDDCNINLFSIIDETTFDKFHSVLKQVFSVVNARNDGEKLKEVINSDEKYENLDKESADIIKEFTSLRVKKTRGGGYSVCKAVMEIANDAQKRGIEQGVDNVFEILDYIIANPNKQDSEVAAELKCEKYLVTEARKRLQPMSQI